MTRTLLTTGAVLALSIATSHAQNLPRWAGFVQFTAFTTACNTLPSGPRLRGPAYSAIYRPKFTAAQPNGALLINFPAHGALLVQSASAAVPTPKSGAYNGILLSGRAHVVNYAGGTYSFVTTPAAIAATTQHIDLTGRITKYINTDGCTATLRGSFFKVNVES